MLKRVLASLAVVLLITSVAIAVALRVRPDLAAYDALRMPSAADPAVPDTGLRVTFLGISTLLFDDGETAFMTDGFFTRPGLLGLLRVKPDRALIADVLRRAGVDSLAAVIPLHSHYDHALDAPEVARQTGAILAGSTSTANIGRGDGLPEDRLRVVGHGDVLRFGRFTVTVFVSRHVPSFALYPGEIDAPLAPPARASRYLMGECYALLVEHGGRSLVVSGSAGWVPRQFEGRTADVVYLGVALLGRQDDAYRDAYWREVVQAVDARRIIAIHWDDFLLPLSRGLLPMQRVLDDFDGTMQYLTERSHAEGRELRLPVLWAATDPFGGLR